MKDNPLNMLDEMANFTFTAKYAKYDEKKKRRETWEETVGRVEKMHLKKYSFLSDKDKDEIKKAFDFVREKRVSPSMRSMQFGGKAVEAHEMRSYNCAVRHIDSIRSFAESFYVLMCGTGVGFGLSNKFISRLPNLVNAEDKNGVVLTYVLEDSIQGWADSIEALLNCYFKNTAFSGRKLVFDYSKIRPAGAKLKTSGGKAPGYKGLKASHKKIKELLDFIIEEKHQKTLKTINAYDILMFLSDAVLSGGVRRSACSVIFDLDDEDMMNAKTGNWIKENPQRARSNNSVKLIRGKFTLEQFNKIIEKTKEFGEPGFVMIDNENQLLNPCFEISFIPVTEDGICGFQVCNLTSINGAKISSLDDFKKASWAASLIGTLQAGYTNFPYLGHVSECLTRQESLLGVSITGLCENPEVLFDADNQVLAAKVAVDTNEIWAKKLKINKAARVTCVKPEGTNSIILSSSSGIHPHHSRQYFRRIQCNRLDNIFQYFKLFNSHACEEGVWSANKTDEVVTFPITISEKAKIKEDLNAIQHLKLIETTQKNWVNQGTTDANKKPLKHSVSCTVIVKNEEWNDVVQYIFDKQKVFTAVSLLPFTGDKIYKQAPMEAVITEEDKIKFNELLTKWQKVPYHKLEELDDETLHIADSACAGGSCEIAKI